MEIIDNFTSQRWIFQFLVALFLAGGVVTVAVGVGLIASSDRTLRFLVAMNRWVSTRRVLSPTDDSRENSQPAQKHRRWLAVIIIAGAVFAIVGLATRFDAAAVSSAFGLNTQPSSVAPWLAESVRWVLIVGNLIAVVIGAGLGLFPDKLTVLEARGERWNSHRGLAVGLNAMNLPFDNWVVASPWIGGWIITVAGLALVGDFAFALLGAR